MPLRLPNPHSPEEVRRAFAEMKAPHDVLTAGAVGEVLVGTGVGSVPAWGTELTALTKLTVDNITMDGAVISSDTGAISFSNENLTTTGTIAGVNVTSGADPGHTHSIYLKADGTVALTGNLAVDALITIDGRDISVDGAVLDAIAVISGQVKIDALATAGYIGAAAGDGVLRTSTGITYTDGGDFVTLTTNDGQIVHDNLSGYVGDQHVAHAGVTLTAGSGLAGGGTIAASRTFALDINGLAADTIVAADTIAFYDDTGAHNNKTAFSDFNAALDHGALLGRGDDDHTQYHTDARAATWLAANHETTYNHANYDTAYGWGNHAGLYDPVGSAAAAVAAHVAAYNHDNFVTAYGWGDHASGGYLKADGSIPLTGDWTTGAFSIIGSDHWYMRADSKCLYFGAADDASITYDATDLVIDPKVVGTGKLLVNGQFHVSDYMSVGNEVGTEHIKINCVFLSSLTAFPQYGIRILGQYGSAGSGNMTLPLYGLSASYGTSAAWNGNALSSMTGLSCQMNLRGSGTAATVSGATFSIVLRDGSGNVTTARGAYFAVVDVSTTSAVTNAYGLYVDNINVGTTLNYAIYTRDGQVRFGDDLFFAGAGAGLPGAGIYCHDAGTTLTIAASGWANKVQVTQFTANETSNLMTPDHTNDHITVVKTGVYRVTASISISSTGGTSYEVAFGCWKNNGATEFLNLHSHRVLSGGGGDKGSMSISGRVSLTAADTLELWAANITNTNNIIIESITLSAVMVGG